MEKPNVKSKTIAEIPKWTIIEIGSKKGSFNQASYRGQFGYVQSTNLECENIKELSVMYTEPPAMVVNEKNQSYINRAAKEFKEGGDKIVIGATLGLLALGSAILFSYTTIGDVPEGVKIGVPIGLAIIGSITIISGASSIKNGGSNLGLINFQ